MAREAYPHSTLHKTNYAIVELIRRISRIAVLEVLTKGREATTQCVLL